MANIQPIITPADLEEDRAGCPQLCPIPAGWPSPADNYVEDTLDLHRMAVPNPAATFFMAAGKTQRQDNSLPGKSGLP